jgi:hypothetical protein
VDRNEDKKKLTDLRDDSSRQHLEYYLMADESQGEDHVQSTLDHIVSIMLFEMVCQDLQFSDRAPYHSMLDDTRRGALILPKVV